MPKKMRKATAYQPVKKPVERPSAHKRGYDKRHTALAAEALRLNPICVRCHKAFAVDAHHKRYGDDITVDDYEAVCRKCHNRITFGLDS